jgi:peptidoglycan/xylan/chitin deacetylase (PgdA/CDA1 family)
MKLSFRDRSFRAATWCRALLVVLPAVFVRAEGQEKAPWHGRKCAVALTYDDGLNVHLDSVIPALDSLNFKGTFYLSGFFPGFSRRVKDWISVAKEGHELGNHTLFHPCEGRSPGREWVKPDYDLNVYTMRRMVDEIQMANTLLEAVDGKTVRTFAYPCGDRPAGDSSYVERVRELFPGARGVEGKMEGLKEVNLYNVGAYMVNGQSGEWLIGLVKEAMAKNALLVFLFHGVGGEHSLTVSSSDHRKLLGFLKANEKEIWVAPLVDIVRFVREERNGQGLQELPGGK